MGKTILTPKQRAVLEYAQSNEEISQWFYFTGGTALSEFYLHHRLSDDLDFFSYSQVNPLKIDKFFKEITPKLHIRTIKKDNIMGLYIYTLTFANGETLKVDFNEMAFEPVERSMVKFGNLIIDSFYDIAINKTYTILDRWKTRDFIDLYFILKTNKFSLEQLIDRVNDKYAATIEQDTIASRLLDVENLPNVYPKMLVPFDFEEMKQFFLKTAKETGERYIFKK